LGFSPDTDEEGLDYIPPEEIKALLNAHGIDRVTLSACHSANLARALVLSGIQQVMGMSYTLMESAAPIMMHTFLDSLLVQNVSFEAAVHGARQALQKERCRMARFGKQVELSDFVVPVLYSSASRLESRLTSQTHYKSSAPHSSWSFRNIGHAMETLLHPLRSLGFETKTNPTIPHISRDMDILSIERKLLTGPSRPRMLLLHGMAGTGKTALLSQIESWWVKTNFIKAAIFLDFDSADSRHQPHAVQYLLTCLQKITNIEPPSIESQDVVDPVPEIVLLIRQNRLLLVLDHLEFAYRPSILHETLGTGTTTIDDHERQLLERLLKELSADCGCGIVILSTRSPRLMDKWMPDIKICDHCLGGLPLLESAAIARNLLHTNSDAEISSDDEVFIEHIVELLDNNPWALGLVLPFLAKLRKPPADLFRLLLVGGQIEKNWYFWNIFSSKKFSPLQDLFISLVQLPTLDLLLLSTGGCWSRIPKKLIFTRYGAALLTDWSKGNLTVNPKYRELLESGQHLELQAIMEELGWWVPESDEYYRVNPLLQLFLQSRRSLWQEIRRSQDFQVLKSFDLPCSEYLNTSLIYYYDSSQDWAHSFSDTQLSDVRDMVNKEFYSLLKVMVLSTTLLDVTSTLWPRWVILFLPLFGQFNVISKNRQRLVFYFLQEVLAKYEEEEKKHTPVALPLDLLNWALEIFSAVNDYYWNNETSKKYRLQTERSLALADRARKAHGDLPAFAETRRRYILEHKARQFLEDGYNQKAEEILRDNIENSPALEGGPHADFINGLARNRQLATLLTIPGLSNEERDKLNNTLSKRLQTSIRTADRLGLSSLAEGNICFARGNTWQLAADLPTFPRIEKSGFYAGFIEGARKSAANTVHRENIPEARVQREKDLETAIAENDFTEQVRCHQQLARWAFQESDIHGAINHFESLLRLEIHISPEDLADARMTYAACLATVGDDKEAVDQVLRGLVLKQKMGLENPPQQQSSAAMPMSDIVDNMLDQMGFRRVDTGVWEAARNQITEGLVKEAKLFQNMNNEERDEMALGMTSFSGMSQGRMREYIEEWVVRKYVLVAE
jgi:hypothetical protein